ncbi:MAG: YggS family pyridoxal phosphate-dependent enzyme [Chloroflexi bacterium]|nr:YggS family pyridoxal phosphate-dependent enzyme [Chloroflexota bacterium]
MSDLQRRIDTVRERIADAAARSGRDASSVTLIGVTKTHAAETVAEAVARGIEHVGENRVQEAAAKAPRVRELLRRDPAWHLIGTLQRNKARAALDLFSMIHSVDSVRLAEALDARADGRRVPILLEVYLGDDAARPGLRADDLQTAVSAITQLEHLDVRGLMTVAPLGLDEDGTRRAFRRLRELRDGLRARFTTLALPELSMGMTNDYPLAIEEGATLVRVGRAIFGERG